MIIAAASFVAGIIVDRNFPAVGNYIAAKVTAFVAYVRSKFVGY